MFDYFFTFDQNFEAPEHQNRTQREKISRGSYFQNFWPDGKLIGARRRSKLECAAPLLSPQSDPGRRHQAVRPRQFELCAKLCLA